MVSGTKNHGLVALVWNLPIHVTFPDRSLDHAAALGLPSRSREDTMLRSGHLEVPQ